MEKDTQSANTLESAIGRWAKTLDAAWNEHNAEKQVALFAQGGVLVTPTGTRAEGRAELLKVSGGKGPTGQTTSLSHIDGIQDLGQGLVVVDLTQTLEGPGTQVVGTKAQAVAVLREEGDAYKALSVRVFPTA
jgi:uncharacterized protein (TIGR02246 family)